MVFEKGKFVLAHVVKVHVGSRGIDPVVLFLGAQIEGEWSSSCPSYFTRGYESRYQLKRRLSGSQGTVLDVLKTRKISCPHRHSISGSSSP
jgi:hypothetical protein